MNLRHIDPRSTDWMDAMLEGDMEGKTDGRPKRVRGGEAAQGELPPVVASQVASQVSSSELLASRPPPGHR
jgi:hypothetical protein